MILHPTKLKKFHFKNEEKYVKNKKKHKKQKKSEKEKKLWKMEKNREKRFVKCPFSCLFLGNVFRDSSVSVRSIFRNCPLRDTLSRFWPWAERQYLPILRCNFEISVSIECVSFCNLSCVVFVISSISDVGLSLTFSKIWAIFCDAISCDCKFLLTFSRWGRISAIFSSTLATKSPICEFVGELLAADCCMVVVVAWICCTFWTKISNFCSMLAFILRRASSFFKTLCSKSVDFFWRFSALSAESLLLTCERRTFHLSPQQIVPV